MGRKGAQGQRRGETRERSERRTYVRFTDISSKRVLASSDSGRSVVFKVSFDGVKEWSSVTETVLDIGEVEKVVSFVERKKGREKETNPRSWLNDDDTTKKGRETKSASGTSTSTKILKSSR